MAISLDTQHIANSTPLWRESAKPMCMNEICGRFAVPMKTKITSNADMSKFDPVFAVLNSGWFALLGLLVGILGIGFSYAFYRRGRSRTELRDMLSEVEIIGVPLPSFPMD